MGVQAKVIRHARYRIQIKYFIWNDWTNSISLGQFDESLVLTVNLILTALNFRNIF